jgi:propionyl-CoA carboxylase alpha chain
MIERLLIANRGEIAVRIARTAHRLGIGTVGVYSEPDRNALHVDAVDVSLALGGSTPAESYLRADAVVAAAVEAGCDAVHPGYGFLAENAGFAQRVIDAGLTWVGPAPEQIRLLGDKVEAKRAAVAAGVPTAPIVEIVDGRVPDEVPLPALVKAAAGGGGRGMRVVRERDELADAVVAASREAESAFGDGTVFVEPYLEHGRHVEVQIVGDHHGGVIHLGERECSIQRRNQKVVEEAPSAGIGDDVRRALCDGAVALARHVGYRNAGTVEFLVGADGTVNFLEVNTRLQVEHPVTEAVTGLDLVEVQLRVADGEPLELSQDDVVTRGHAIEVRLVAEDPAAGWLPSTGTLTSFRIGDGVRVDTGFRAGAAVSPDYDSLLAKVIAQAPTRVGAARVLARALRTSQVTGVATNLETLAAICAEPAYLAADTPTSYLERHPEVLEPPGPDDDDRLALLTAAVIAVEDVDRGSDPTRTFAPVGWRNLRTVGQRQVWVSGAGTAERHDHSHGGDEHHIEYVPCDRTRLDLLVGPWPEPTDDGSLAPDERRRIAVRVLRRGPDEQVVELDGRRHVVATAIDGDVVRTAGATGAVTWRRRPRFVVHDAGEAAGGPVSPLPGTVIDVRVADGDHVAEGALLVVVEAMKMEHKITAGTAATVTAVHVAVGDRVDTGQLLVSLEAAPHTSDEEGE